MFAFNAGDYGPYLSPLVVRDDPPSLGPGTPDRGHVRQALSKWDPEEAFGRPVSDRSMADCCHSAVWLLHDCLDESHEISQSIATTTGSYWHGIMHRREPDYPNAKYWFRRVGDRHPVFERLAAEACSLADNIGSQAKPAVARHPDEWDPFAFVDLCQAVYRSGNEQESLCERVALLEWQLLFDYCYRKATA